MNLDTGLKNAQKFNEESTGGEVMNDTGKEPLKGPTGQSRSAREWYNWKPMVSAYALDFTIFSLYLL